MIVSARVPAQSAGERLDDVAAQLFPQLSKTKLRKIIDWGGCAVNASMVRVASRPLSEGDEIIIGVMEPDHYVELVWKNEDILYEDSEYVAINKPAGINSQRTPYQLNGTVEHAIALYLKKEGLNDPVMIVHRLDRGTSGVMFFPKTKRAAAHLSLLLKDGGVSKVYWAIVSGRPSENKWEVDAPITKTGTSRYGVGTPGKEAQTRFRSLSAGTSSSLVEALPLTGRTHQIRVHLIHCGYPIVGDHTYGHEKAARMMLHCRSMSFRGADGRRIEAIAPVDAKFANFCNEHGLIMPEMVRT